MTGEPANSEPESDAPASDAPAVEVIDNRRTPCAIGLIRAARRVQELAPATRVDILSKDRFAPMEVPIWAERDGHRLLGHGREGVWPGRYWRFELEVRGDGAAA